MTVMGTGAAEFTVSSGCGSTLAAGSSCVIDAAFKPAAKVAYTAALVVSDNAQSSPQTI